MISISMAKINLDKTMFTQRAPTTPLVEHGELKAALFRYATGVDGIELSNSLGKLIVLPFQGQQIWDATMQGRRLTMKSMYVVRSVAGRSFSLSAALRPPLFASPFALLTIHHPSTYITKVHGAPACRSKQAVGIY
jgi:hypothetical protein